MIPYWLLFALGVAGAIEYRPKTSSALQGGPLLVVLGIAMALLVGLRFEVGGDWPAYILMFENFRYAGMSELWASDPAYSFLNWAAHQVGAGVWLVNLVCAALFCWGLTVFARHQPNPWLVLVVATPYLVIVVGMGYTRQAVAIGLILGGLAALQRKAIATFFVYICLAAAFHKTAVLILPIVGFALAQQRATYALLTFASVVLLYLAFLQSAIDQFILVYEDAQYTSEGAAIRVTMNIVPAIVFLMLRRRFGLIPFENKLWGIFAYASIGTFFLLMSLDSSTAVDRVALYLIPVQLFVLSRLPFVFSKEVRASPLAVVAVVIYSALVQFVWLNYARHSEYWLPYRFYPLIE